MLDVMDELHEILTEEFEVEATTIDPTQTLDDLGVDSLAAVELTDVLQDKYHIVVGTDECKPATTIAEVLKIITERVHA